MPLILAIVSFGAAPVLAASPPADDALFQRHEGGAVTVDAGLMLALPVALRTGLSTGAVAGVSIGSGQWAVGLRGAWSTATESSLDWTLTRADMKLRVTGAVQQRFGRGLLGLRLGLGPTLVHETRSRNQAARANLAGLGSSNLEAVPSADLDGVVAVQVAGPWLLTIGAGPSLALVDGGTSWGWTSLLGAGWQP